MDGFKKIRFGLIAHRKKQFQQNSSKELRAGGEFGDGFGSFRDSVLGEFPREHETNSSLDFTATKCGFLVVGGQLSSLRSDTLKDVVDEGVHDRHTLLGDASIRMDLLEDLVDVATVGLRALLRLLGARGFLGRRSFR